MNYRMLGKSNLLISEISFGCMSLSVGDSNNDRLLQQAIDGGINFFDTADLYEKGQNEVMIGKYLKSKRKELIIASKVGNQWRPDGSGWDWNPNKAYILKSAEESLRRLQTDYIDLYQLHGGTMQDPIPETIEAFEILKSQGKIRFYGISSIRPEVIREYIKLSGIVSVMMQYSLLDRRPEESSLQLLQGNNIGLLARGALTKGLLIDKPATAYLAYTAEQVSGAADAIAAVSGENRNRAATALHFVLQHPAITSAVTGIRNEQQLADAIGAVDSPALTQEEMDRLRQSIPENRYDLYR